jgi:hypothetical protein
MRDMRIVSYRGPHHAPLEHVDQPLDPARITLMDDGTLVLGILTKRIEWRLTLSSDDLAGGALDLGRDRAGDPVDAR